MQMYSITVGFRAGPNSCRSVPPNQLLVVHFDADAESWELCP